MEEKKIYASENLEEKIKKIIENEFGKLNSNKVILLEKNLKHIEERHPEVIEILKNNFSDIIKNPDYVLKDEKNTDTIWHIKSIKEKNTRVVIKLSIKNKEEHKKFLNSIITAHKVRKQELKRLIKRNKQILTKR